MKIHGSVVRLLWAGTTLLTASFCPPAVFGVGQLLANEENVKSFMEVIAGVAAGNTANAIESLPIGNNNNEKSLSLENEHLTRTIGKAIAALIYTEAKIESKKYPKQTQDKLKIIAKKAKDNWLKIAREESGKWQPSYPALMERNIADIITPTQNKLTQETCLSIPQWTNIVSRLEKETNSRDRLPSDIINSVAKRLHHHFPKALREALKADFTSKGEAFAGLMISLLTEMKSDLVKVQKEQGLNFAVVFDGLNKIEQKLNKSASDQKKVFIILSRRIDSGFEKLLKELDGIGSRISEVLQEIDEIKDSIEQIQQTTYRTLEITEVIKEKQDAQTAILEHQQSTLDAVYQMNLSQSLLWKISRCLLGFDYTDQEYLFYNFVKEYKLGACLIHGLEGSAQPWLVYRLLKKLHYINTSSLVIKMSWARRTGKLNIREEICRGLQISVNSNLNEIFRNIFRHLDTKSIVFIIKDIEKTTPEAIEQFLREFWQPLVTQYDQHTSNSDSNRLLFLLIDLDGTTNEWQISCDDNIESRWMPHKLYKLKRIEPLSETDRRHWFQQFAYELEEEGIVRETSQLVIQQSSSLRESTIPHERILQYICQCYSINWDEIENQWQIYY